MMEPIRWGIMATGNIARKFAQGVQHVPQGQLGAVASRTQAKADAFGQYYDIPHRYGSYEALVADPEVDVIYIATPHSHHYENMLLCLRAGKHVLCEKAFTLNAAQAAECITLARQHNLFLMEAMWMRFFPAIAQLRQWVQEGVLGDIRLLQADFCVNLPFDPAHRIYDPDLGGGALLDLGIYPLSLATMLLGLPQTVNGHAHLSPTGVDELAVMTLSYDAGASAVLTCSSRLNRPREAWVVGTKGYVKIHEWFFFPEHLTLHLHDSDPQTLAYPFKGNGYIHEIEEVHACLRAGQTESTIMPLDETLALMKLMDQLRAQWGVVYPSETA